MSTSPTTPALDERASVVYAHRPRSRTHSVAFTVPVGAEPVDVFEALSAAGWKRPEDSGFKSAPPYRPIDFDTPDPARGTSYTTADYEVVDVAFTKGGAGLFGEWTASELSANLAEADRILASFGIPSPVIAEVEPD